DVHRGAPAASSPARAAAPAPAKASASTETAATGPVTGWAVAAIPSDAEAPPEDMPEPPLPDEPAPDPFSFLSAPDAPAPAMPTPVAAERPAPTGPSLAELARSAPAPEPALSASQVARYGEAVVREELGAELIEERPRVR